jgi:hypothetical protein
MKLHEFINQEFKQVAAKEINQLFDAEQSKSLCNKIDAIVLDPELEEIENLAGLFDQDKDLRKLKNAAFVLDKLVKLNDLEFSPKELEYVKNRMNSRPDDRLLPLLWIYGQIYIFENEECFESEVAGFFKLLFEKFRFLVEIDNFFEETRINEEVLNAERLRNSNEFLYPVFADAVDRYPENLHIRRILGYICYYKGTYTESIDHLNRVIRIIREKDLLMDELDYPKIMEYLALNYDKLGDDEKVSECVENVLSNLPLAVYSDGSEAEASDPAIPSFFLRMRLNIKNRNRQKVLEDYNRVKEYLLLWDWENDFPDVMKFVEGTNTF